jgi:phosphatidylglycerol:prolipoprotein diacylglycerol transferase
MGLGRVMANDNETRENTVWPIHLDLGFKVIHFYEGFYFLIAILAAAALAARRLKKAGLGTTVFLDGLPWILLSAILGARIFDFLFWDMKTLLAHPLSFFLIWEGGLSITGGLAGGVIAAFIWFRRAKIDFWHAFAVASPAVLVGQAIGRLGCFLNGDAWGVPTTLPWGIPLPKYGTILPWMTHDHSVPSEAWNWCVQQGHILPSALATVPLHPTQLYEAMGDLALAAIVILLAKKVFEGDTPWSRIFWFHLGGYSVLRFGLEFLHGDRDALVWAGMTALQIGLLGFAAVAGALFLRAGRPGRG